MTAVATTPTAQRLAECQQQDREARDLAAQAAMELHDAIRRGATPHTLHPMQLHLRNTLTTLQACAAQLAAAAEADYAAQQPAETDEMRLTKWVLKVLRRNVEGTLRGSRYWPWEYGRRDGWEVLAEAPVAGEPPAVYVHWSRGYVVSTDAWPYKKVTTKMGHYLATLETLSTRFDVAWLDRGTRQERLRVTYKPEAYADCLQDATVRLQRGKAQAMARYGDGHPQYR